MKIGEIHPYQGSTFMDYKSKILMLGIALASLAFIGISCPFGGGGATTGPANVTLTYWRMDDDEAVFKPLIEAFKEKNPDVDIVYKRINPADYKEKLLNALAANKGPDIVSLPNDWLPMFVDKLLPAPDSVMTAKQFKDTFVPVASDDLVIDNKIYGMPLYIDSLALFYNNELSSAIRLFKPPKTWSEFILDAKKLTIKKNDRIIQSGAALGTAKNTENATDILSLLMLQNGTEMVSSDKKSATFNVSQGTEGGKPVYLAARALNFYTSFANPDKPTYMWNDNMPTSVRAFAQDKAVMMIHYSSIQSILKALNPTLSYDIAPIPQISTIETPINFANYNFEAITKDSIISSKNPRTYQTAWEFIKFISTGQIHTKYLQATKKPSSLNEDTQSYRDVFESQANTAKNWYKIDSIRIEIIFEDMIRDVVNFHQPIQRSIDSAAAKITNLLKTNED